MYITQASEINKQILTQFLLPHEENCVQLCSYFRKSTNNIFILQASQETPQTINDIIGVLYIDNSIFFCIPDISKIDDSSILKDFLYKKHKEHNIKSISGNALGTQFLIEILSLEISKPYQVNHYILMTCNNVIEPPENLYNDDEIKRCTENDMDTLIDLQKSYLQEEVAPAGKKVSALETSMSLRQILKNQLCMALYSDGEAVAKVNTNAIGINYVQLGGVYTQSLYRRNGYAWHLVYTLCKRTEKSGKKTALFVKDINVPAILLYKKLGFTEKENYTIAYF